MRGGRSFQPSSLSQHGAEVVFGSTRFGECFLERGDGLGQWRNVLADRRQDVAGDVERPAFLLDLVEADDLGAVLDILKNLEPVDNLFGVLGIEEVLGAAIPEEGRGVDDEHLVFPLGGLLAAEDHDTAGEAGAVEEIRCEADDRFDHVFFEQGFADLAFGALAEECALDPADESGDVLR